MTLDNAEKLEEKIKQLQSEKALLVEERTDGEKLNRQHLQDIKELRTIITLFETTIETGKQEMEKLKKRKWYQKFRR